MNKHVEVLGSLAPVRAVSGAKDIVVGLVKNPRDVVVLGAGTLDNVEGRNGMIDFALGIAGAFVGHRMFKRSHPVLGIIGGFDLGVNARPLAVGSSDERKRAMYNLALGGAGIGASVAWKKHPALGYAAGSVAALAAMAYVPGSPVQQMYARAEAANAAEERAAASANRKAAAVAAAG